MVAMGREIGLTVREPRGTDDASLQANARLSPSRRLDLPTPPTE